MHVCFLQFIKAKTGNWGEIRAARQVNIEWHALGDGFTRRSKDLDKSADKARQAWALAQEKIAHGSFGIVVLDEMTYPFRHGWLDVHQVIAWLREHKPPDLHLIITGRDAPPELIEFADLVTEMREIKHSHARGVKVQPGIEF